MPEVLVMASPADGHNSQANFTAWSDCINAKAESNFKEIEQAAERDTVASGEGDDLNTQGPAGE